MHVDVHEEAGAALVLPGALLVALDHLDLQDPVRLRVKRQRGHWREALRVHYVLLPLVPLVHFCGSLLTLLLLLFIFEYIGIDIIDSTGCDCLGRLLQLLLTLEDELKGPLKNKGGRAVVHLPLVPADINNIASLQHRPLALHLLPDHPLVEALLHYHAVDEDGGLGGFIQIGQF